MDRTALILRGPTASGKSTVATVIESVCCAKRLKVEKVNLDDGWMPNEYRAAAVGNPAARYADVVAASGGDADLVMVEFAYGEPGGPAQGATGATIDPAEWANLLTARRVLAVRLSGPAWLLSQRRQGRQGQPYGQLENAIHSVVDANAGTTDLHGKSGLSELVVPITRGGASRSAAEVAADVLRFLGLV